MTESSFRAHLEQMIDIKHPLAILASRMLCDQIEAVLTPCSKPPSTRRCQPKRYVLTNSNGPSATAPIRRKRSPTWWIAGYWKWPGPPSYKPPSSAGLLASKPLSRKARACAAIPVAKPTPSSWDGSGTPSSGNQQSWASSCMNANANSAPLAPNPRPRSAFQLLTFRFKQHYLRFRSPTHLTPQGSIVQCIRNAKSILVQRTVN